MDSLYFHGVMEIPWIHCISGDSLYLYGFPSISMDSLYFHGFHGISMNSWHFHGVHSISMDSCYFHGFQGGAKGLNAMQT